MDREEPTFNRKDALKHVQHESIGRRADGVLTAPLAHGPSRSSTRAVRIAESTAEPSGPICGASLHKIEAEPGHSEHQNAVIIDTRLSSVGVATGPPPGLAQGAYPLSAVG
jgi:hypothetical protein